MYGTVGARGRGVAAQDMELVSRRRAQRVGTTHCWSQNRTSRYRYRRRGARRSSSRRRMPAPPIAADPAYTRMVTIWKIPIIAISPASSDTYWSGETITVLVPWGRTATKCLPLGCSIAVRSVGIVELIITVGNASRKLTGLWENRESRYGRTACNGRPCYDRHLWFDYSGAEGRPRHRRHQLAQNTLNSPGNAQSGIRGSAGGGQSVFELEKALHGFGNQARHKVDTPAPSFIRGGGAARHVLLGGVGQLPAADDRQRGRGVQRQLFGDTGAARGLFAEQLTITTTRMRASGLPRSHGRTTLCGLRTVSAARSI